MNPASLYLYFSVLYLGNALIQGWLFWKTRRRLSLFFALMQIGNCYIYFYYGLFYAGFLPDFEILSGTSLMMQFANIFSSYYMIRYLLYPDDSFPRRSLLVHLPFFFYRSFYGLSTAVRGFQASRNAAQSGPVCSRLL